jgi:hypothetical protein
MEQGRVTQRCCTYFWPVNWRQQRVFPVLGPNLLINTPPPPRSLRISALAENCEIIHGAQSLTGKILSRKGLMSHSSKLSSKTGQIAIMTTVVASTMMAQSEVCAQGRASHLGCGKKNRRGRKKHPKLFSLLWVEMGDCNFPVVLASRRRKLAASYRHISTIKWELTASGKLSVTIKSDS